MSRLLFLELLCTKWKEKEQNTETERQGEAERDGEETWGRCKSKWSPLTELSRTPLPSVSYSRNMTRGKGENRDPMMTQIISSSWKLKHSFLDSIQMATGLKKCFFCTAAKELIRRLALIVSANIATDSKEVNWAQRGLSMSLTCPLRELLVVYLRHCWHSQMEGIALLLTFCQPELAG